IVSGPLSRAHRGTGGLWESAGSVDGFVLVADVGMLAEVGRDLLRGLGSNNRGDLLHRGLADSPHRPEVADEVALALLADALDLIQDGEDHTPLAQLAVVG